MLLLDTVQTDTEFSCTADGKRYTAKLPKDGTDEEKRAHAIEQIRPHWEKDNAILLARMRGKK